MLLTTALAGCAVEPDIVARLPVSEPTDSQPPPVDAGKQELAIDGGVGALIEAGIPRDAGKTKDARAPSEVDGGTPYDVSCTDAARHLYLIDKAGALSRVRAGTLEVEPLGTPDCLTRGVTSAAVDQQGMLWVSLQDQSLWWVSPGSASCTPSEVEAKVSSMTFVYDLESNRELLYFVESLDSLAVLDPATLETTRLGAIDTKSLIGTGLDADLLALGELDETTLSLDWVSLDDAVVTPMWKIARQPQQILHGATFWRGDIVLLLDSDLITYRRELDRTGGLPIALRSVDSYTVLASSVCGASTK